MIANEKFVRVFRSTIQSPYPISALSLEIASNVLARANHIRETINTVRAERRRVYSRLANVDGVKVFSSDANFLFIEADRKYQLISKTLKKNGIIVKKFGNISGHRGCMRVTIGTHEMNDKFLECVEGPS